MKILGIESSCDETSAAVIENGTEILSNVVTSSISLHEKTGGIIPENAAREQVKYIIPVVEEALRLSWKQNLPAKKIPEKHRGLFSNIDAIAVTVGPGLIGSLLIGVETAKTISFITGLPLIGANHIFAHIYANWLAAPRLPVFPALALVVSGGHTELFYMKNHGDLKWLGGTRDDAAGEAFDKTARLLGLGYPGGPAIAAAAARLESRIMNHESEIRLPRPMLDEDNLEFSFSGLKTAVIKEMNRLKTIQQYNNSAIDFLAHEIQESITDVLVKKTLIAAEKYRVRCIVLGGGVAANRRLTEKFKQEIGNWKLEIGLHIPPPKLCTDNAAYIASYAFFNNHPAPWEKIQAQPNLSVEV